MKKLGISIDGVIRNYLEAFDKQYRKHFIYNESIVEMSEEFQYKEPTEQDLEDKTKKIEDPEGNTEENKYLTIVENINKCATKGFSKMLKFLQL